MKGAFAHAKGLVETDSARVLVDCGLFQGVKALRQRNWSSPPLVPRELDAVVLTHAHIDHSGYLPLLWVTSQTVTSASARPYSVLTRRLA